MYPPFPTEQAHAYCESIINKLHAGSLSLRQVSAPSRERDGHGVMIGTLVCTDVSGRECALAAVSGNSLVFDGDTEEIISVPPVVSPELISHALAPNDKRIHELTEQLKKAPEAEKRGISAARAVLTEQS